MDSKTIVVVGAGKGLGLGVARRFGKEGYQVALLARRKESLDELCATLKSEGIAAEGFVADAGDAEALGAALEAVKRRFGSIDVLEYSPSPGPQDDGDFYAATKLNPATISRLHRLVIVGAVTCVQSVLPDMLARGEGSILMTTSGSAHHVMPVYTPVGMVMSALRSYALALNKELEGTGVFAGSLCVSVLIRQDDPIGDPYSLADRYYQMHTNHSPVEDIAATDEDPNTLHDKDMAERGIDWKRPELAPAPDAS